MNATTKTRSQRRMEKKQTLILLVLVLAVSLASFFLGAVVGRQGAERELAQKQQAAERILVAPAPRPAAEPVPPQAVEPEGTEKSTEQEADSGEQGETKLTFYDDLAKEEKVPLGSGINLPPEEKVEQKTVAQPPIPLPEKPIVKKALSVEDSASQAKPKASEVATAAMPAADPNGTYAVQVGSFNAAGDAGAFKKRLQEKGFPAFVAEADLGAKGLWYRVRIGPYADADSAKKVQKLAEEKEQIKGFISRQ